MGGGQVMRRTGDGRRTDVGRTGVGRRTDVGRTGVGRTGDEEDGCWEDR